MKLPVASYSFLNNWDTCRHRAYRMYIARDLPREPESPEMRWGNEVHEALEKRLRDKTPLPEPMREFEHYAVPLDPYEIAPEQKLGMTAAGTACGFFADDVFLRGKLDVPVVFPNNVAMLVDWKTGKPREDPYELEVGALLLKANNPDIRLVRGRYIWLKECRLGKDYDLSDFTGTWARVCGTMRDVQDAIDIGVFHKTQGPLCGWCPVRDCQHNRSRT